MQLDWLNSALSPVVYGDIAEYKYIIIIIMNTGYLCACLKRTLWGHGDRVVTLSPPTSEARVSIPGMA